MRLSIEQFSTHVAGHAGIDTARARSLAQIVLSTTGAYLSRSARELVAEELAPELGASIVAQAGIETAVLPIEERLGGLAASAGHSRELVASVYRVLAEHLSTEALHVLRRGLPSELAMLLEPSTVRELPRRRTGRGTLSEGAPGSRTPISEAHPDERQSSAVAAANPHADDKLSSGRPHARTIADGRPGPGRWSTRRP